MRTINRFGLAALAVALSCAIASSAEAKFKVLYNFDPSGGGVNPWDSLISDGAGNYMVTE